jgi:1-acyl-sn-glycerol-3-phosphate acyltransferase
MGGWRKSSFEDIMKKYYLFYCQVIRYILATGKLVLFLLITIFLLPLYFLGKLIKLVFVSNYLEVLIKSFWSRLGLRFCNIQVEVHGMIDLRADGFACNHVSWLDILAIQSIADVAFVAKSEVKGWPLFGFLANIADTVFIDRRIMAAKGQQADLLKSLCWGKKLFFFPEGTSTDGSYVLPFKSSIFEVFITLTKGGRSGALVQPVILKYYHSDIGSPMIFSWWGDMSILPHIIDVLANAKSGKIAVFFEETLDAHKIGNRKKLALVAERAVRSIHDLRSADTQI